MRIFIFILIFQLNLFSQDSLNNLNNKSKVNNYKLGALLGLSSGAFIYGQIDQKEKYWSNTSDFNIMPWHQEYDDALMADKFGHFYFGYTLSKLYTSALNWCGVDTINSSIYASALTLAFHTYVEINDGFSSGKPYLGFSRADMVADVLGAGYNVLQTYYPDMKNISFKISFEKSSNFTKNGYSNLSDDYESTYHWISIDIYNLLESDLKKYYPSFINLAFGHSVKDIDRNGKGHHEIYIGMDWNFNRLPIEGEFSDFIKKTLSIYKLPAPAIKIYPELIWYGLKF